MKLRDHPDTTPVSDILLQMPDDVYEQVKNTGLPGKQVYFKAPFSSPLGYWLSTPESGTRIFPISGRPVEEVLDWEVLS